MSSVRFCWDLTCYPPGSQVRKWEQLLLSYGGEVYTATPSAREVLPCTGETLRVWKGYRNIHSDPCCVPGSQALSTRALILAWQTCLSWTSDCLWGLQFCLKTLLGWVSLWAIKDSLWLSQLAFNCLSKALSFSQKGSPLLLCRASVQN